MKLLNIEKSLLISYFTLIVCLILKANYIWLITWAVMFGWVSFGSRLKESSGNIKNHEKEK